MTNELSILEHRALGLCQKLFKMRSYAALGDHNGMRATVVMLREDVTALVSLVTLLESAVDGLDLTAELQKSVDAVKEKKDGV